MSEGKKKSIFKKWWFWLGAVIILIIIAGNLGGKDQPATSPKSTPVTSAAPGSSAPAESKEPKNKETISKAEFDQIKNGMTYDEVKKIIGSEGEVMSEVGEKGTEFYTILYMWDGDGKLGANANFTFQDEKLEMKAQMGLE